MSAIYGIYGDGDLSEVRSMGRRLLHRGQGGSEWSVASNVHFGQRVRGDYAASFVPPPCPVVFDGFLDNRDELALLLGRREEPRAGGDDACLVFEIFQKFGPDGFRLLNGQFTVAIWDAEGRRLILARDLWAARPLYWTHIRGRYLFASEYKALLAIGEVPVRPNKDVIQYVQCTRDAMADACYLADVYPFPGSSWTVLGVEGPVSRRYWNTEINIVERSVEAHAAALRETVLDAVRMQTRQYETIGVALSGGLDAALSVAGIRHVAPHKAIYTFTAGFGPEDGEIIRAAAVARHFGTRHHEIFLDPPDLENILPLVVWHMEDPIGHEEKVFNYLAAREAAKHVDMLYSGHKSDSLFGGMPRHKVVKAATLLPIARVPLEEFYRYTQTGTPARTVLGRALITWYYKGAQVPPPHVLGAVTKPDGPMFAMDHEQPLSEMLRRSIFSDGNTNSGTERLHAAFGLDFNSPFMNNRVVECALQIPDRLKIRGMEQKYIIRRAFAGLLPSDILKRKKSLQKLKHDERLGEVLESLADKLLSPAAVASRGLFEPAYVERVRRRPAHGVYQREEQVYRLWTMLLTEIWSRLYLDGRGEAPK